MSSDDQTVAVVSVAAGLERTAKMPARPGPEHRKLDVFVGKWINQGHTVARDGVPPTEILTSDVYEWVPGGFFLIHTAYGRIGEHGVGGIEIISYDPAPGSYISRFFDSQGNAAAAAIDAAARDLRAHELRVDAFPLGDEGHLSNEQAAELLRETLARSIAGRLRRLVQLHLSQQCNRPALARGAAKSVADQLVPLEHIVQDSCSDDGTQDWLPHDKRKRQPRQLARVPGEIVFVTAQH
jgi:hypothetical protein